MKDKKIAVVMGGPSAEREVSLNTGQAILAALQEKGYNAIGIDLVPHDFIEQLRTEKIDIVFNAIHGLYGEDGLMQGTLEMLGIPYTGAGVLSSAIAMDKIVSKRLFTAAGLRHHGGESIQKRTLGEIWPLKFNKSLAYLSSLRPQPGFKHWRCYC